MRNASMRNVVLALLGALMLAGCNRRLCHGGIDPCSADPGAVGSRTPVSPPPSAPYRSSTTAPAPSAGSAGGGTGADPSAEPWSAFVTVDGETCDIASATGSSVGVWAVTIRASCPSLGSVSILGQGDPVSDYPQDCNDDGTDAAVQLAICYGAGAACGGYSYDAHAPGSCAITEGPTAPYESATISFIATVTDGATSHDVVAYAAPTT